MIKKIFNKEKNIIIGAIHFAPLFGYSEFPGLEKILENALVDLRALEQGGVDAVIIENNYDIPHKVCVEKETVDQMIYLGKEIKNATKLPLGVSVLWNDYKSALVIAKNIGAQFIRVPVFVDNVKTSYGEIFGNPNDVLEFRKNIEAEDVALFVDIHVKHAELLDKKTIEASAKEAIDCKADALIITGKWTGNAPDIDELKKVRNVAESFPIIIGSGANEENIKELLSFANGAIVSTSLKEGEHKEGETNVKTWEQRIDKEKVSQLIKKL